MESVDRLVRAVDLCQQRHASLALPVAVWKKFNDDQAGNLAAMVAYYAFVALFPLLLVLVTVLNLVLKDDPALQKRLLNSALGQYPVIGQQLQHNIGPLHQSGVALAVGLIGMFIGSRGVANSMQNALNTAWEIPMQRRPAFPWSWLRSFALILVVGLGLIGTSVLSGLASGAGGLLTGAGAFVLATALSLVLNIGVFWLAFWLGTASEVGWRKLWVGAVLGAAVWQALQTFGGYLVAHQLARSSSLYGTFAVVLGLLAWLYLVAELTLYVIEVDVVRAYRLWPRSLAPPPYTEPDRRAFKLYALIEKRDNVGGEENRATTSG